MYFENKKTKNSRITLNYLRSVRYWHRPGAVLQEIFEVLKENKVTDFTKLNNSYIELYTGALLVAALEEDLGIDFWIAKPKEDPPDLAFMTIRKDNKGRIWTPAREVEITRYTDSKNSLLDVILRKDIHYPKDYVLVCFIEVESSVDLKKLSEKIRSKLTRIKHVFLVFHGVMYDEMIKLNKIKDLLSKVSVVQLSPVYDVQLIDINEVYDSWRKDDFKLAYVLGAEIYYGLREEDDEYPKIII